MEYTTLASRGDSTVCIDDNYNVWLIGSKIEDFSSNVHSKNGLLVQIPGLCNIKVVSITNETIICSDYEGNVYSLGSNNFGGLGIGEKDISIKTNIPQKLTIPLINNISCGSDFCICLTDDRKLYSFGNGSNGSLGIGKIKFSEYPQLIPNISDIEIVECGSKYVVCKSFNGDNYAWGLNKNGEFGNGTYESSNFPVKCLNWPDNIISIKCGVYFTLFLTLHGQVYSCGNNEYHQLGKENEKKRNIPQLVDDLPEIRKIECGTVHSMLIDVDDYLWVFGDNYFGQLGTGDTVSLYKPFKHKNIQNIIGLSHGGLNSIIKTMNNEIYVVGYNNRNQLGIDTRSTQLNTPNKILIGEENIWYIPHGKSRAKSARK